MTGCRVHLVLAAFVAWGICATHARADGDPPNSDESKISRLEALLEAQQKQIEALQQQVATQGEADMNGARIEEMRKQIREVLSEREFRESLMPTTTQTGYDNGFYIKSSDDKFKIRFNGNLQFRYTYYQAQKYNHYLVPSYRRWDKSGFDWNRFRFIVSGNVYTPDLTYWMELEMGSASSLNAGLLYGYVNYRFRDELQFRAGTFRLASTRADFGSTAAMQFPEYPYMNGVMGLTRGTGVRLWGKLFKDQGEYFLDVVNALGKATAQTITNDEDYYRLGHDSNPAIVFRTVWQILRGQMEHPEAAAAWTDAAPDLEYHTSPALNAGFHYAFQSDWTDGALKVPFPNQSFYRPGVFGLTTSQGLQVNQFGFDAGFKWRGLSVTGEYVIRMLDVTAGDGPVYSPLYQFTHDGGTNGQQGAYVQAGYLLPLTGYFERKIELVARIGGLSALSGGQAGEWDYEGGVNYYIQGNKVKLQADVTKMTAAPFSSPNYGLANVNDSPLLFRVQLQVAF